MQCTLRIDEGLFADVFAADSDLLVENERTGIPVVLLLVLLPRLSTNGDGEGKWDGDPNTQME